MGDDSVDMEKQAEAIIEFYVSKCLDYMMPKVKSHVRGSITAVDGEYINTAVDKVIETHSTLFAKKTNTILLILLEIMANGDFDTLGRFEVLFLDLLQRHIIPTREKLPLSLIDLSKLP